jgi:fatty acid desaturase
MMFVIVLQYPCESAHLKVVLFFFMSPAPSSDDDRLTHFTATQDPTQQRPKSVSWYRTKIKPATLKALHRRSDGRGAAQTLGFLAVITTTAALAVYSAYHWSVAATVALTFLHGTVFAFNINAVHELGHGTVFRTRRLNDFFAGLFAFLGWVNHYKFDASHTQHHRYTLHPPDDLEVKLPIRLVVKDWLRAGFVDFGLVWFKIKEVVRESRGIYRGEWEEHLFPAADPDRRKAPTRWGRVLLGGHLAIVLISVLKGWWMIPVVVTLAPFYGAWLFFLCNSTQHIGMQDHVSDFRLCCRTFTTNPVFQFLYWHMNFHIEHHMYAAVPCYRLGKLHRTIQSDLPPCPHGLVATWREIAAIQTAQEEDPDYKFTPRLPDSPVKSASA